jgi:hypothetical protein
MVFLGSGQLAGFQRRAPSYFVSISVQIDYNCIRIPIPEQPRLWISYRPVVEPSLPTVVLSVPRLVF